MANFVIGGTSTNPVAAPFATTATNTMANPTASTTVTGTPGTAMGGALDASQSTLSPNFDSYVYNMLNKGEQAANLPYQGYTGERFAGPSSLQSQAFQGLGALQLPGQFGQATAAYGSAMGDKYDMSNPASISAFMSPYMQGVVDINKREAERAAAIRRAQLGAQAARAGGLGGGRLAIQSAELDRNTAQQLADIQAKGGQSAWDAAIASISAQRAAAMTGAQGLAALGGQQLGAEQGILGSQLSAGATQRELAQQPLDFGYKEWQESLAYPQTQAENMQKLLTGLPLKANPYSTGTEAASLLSQLLTGGLGGLSLYNTATGT